MTTKLSKQVREFHAKFGQHIGDKPEALTPESLKLRMRIITEEFLEFLSACGADLVMLGTVKGTIHRIIESHMRQEQDLPEMVDALADLDYVIEGIRLAMGVDGGPIADAVHAANMRKVGGPLREDGKILKPQGWTPPLIDACLYAQGWKDKP